MLPREMPVLRHGPVVLRPFEETDIDVVLEVADDPLVPLMTTVPTSGTMADARAYLERQHERLRTGSAYSFAIADAGTNQAVGLIGLWLRTIDQGRASTGSWIGPGFSGRGYATGR